MCTVSIVKFRDENEDFHGDALSSPMIRIGCNRDESRARPQALPPEIRRCGSLRAVYPIDPVSDGTWIAVNELGVAATLLNVYAQPFTATASGRSDQLQSRGVIVPTLMQFESAARAAAALQQFDAGQFPPFRVVIVDERSVVEACSDGNDLLLSEPGGYQRPLMFTSSGLGDELVEGPRRSLFEEAFLPRLSNGGQSAPDTQDEFHRHQWAGRLQLSVSMERAEARTVSYTAVEIRPTHVTMIYYLDSPHLRPAPVRETLKRRAAT